MHKRESWPGKFEPIPPLYARLIHALARFEPVNVLAGGTAVMEEAKQLIGDVPSIRLHDIPTNDAWTRDHGPTFLVGPPNSPPVLVDWGYNAWGGKYPPFDLDDAVPKKIADATGRRRLRLESSWKVGHRSQRPGHDPHHRAMPAQSQPQPGLNPRQ